MIDTSTQLLRPHSLENYIGQQNAVNTLRVFIEAVKSKGQPSEHILLYGPPGIGKTTLANIIAHELEGEIKVTSGPVIQKTGDLAAILTNLKDNDVLFIDEIHRLPKAVEEMLYPVMEDYFLDIIIGKGPSARTVRLPVPRITIVGATTRFAMLSAPLRDRFGLVLRLDFYTESDMIEIIMRSAALLSLPLEKKHAREIALRARRTPRLANRILKRAHDMLLVQKITAFSDTLFDQLFELLELDAFGLSEIDRQYMRVIADKFQNNPVGIETIASALSEDKQTIEEFIEPYLLQMGFLRKTPRGRTITPRALSHLHIVNSDLQEALI
jgi:Holliday junction DNA helicase RuvB